MTNWKYKYEEVNKILYNCDKDYYFPEEVQKIGTKVYHILKDKPGMGGFNLELLIRLQDMSKFNRIIDSLYDYADRNLIWLGIG